MLPPGYLERLPEGFLQLVRQAEEDILADMARRIAKTGRLTDTARWQGERLEQLGLEREAIRSNLQRLTGKSQGEINALFEEAGEAALYYDDLIYQAIGLSPIAANASPALVQLLNAGARQTNRTFENLTATTANTATRQFERALDRAWTQIATGAFDYQTAIRRTVKDLAAVGLQAIVYPSGHADSLDVAARRAILTGVNQTAARLSEARAEEMGCDLVETTAHHGARPSHMVWQGQVFSRSGTHPTYPDFEESTGYGTGAGLCGWNCRHSFFPFFEGLSKSAYPREALREYARDTVTYNGKKMSVYDATQRQRYIERQIRRWKREYLMMDAAGQSTAQASAKLAQWRAAEKDFCRQTGLDPDNFRSQVYGFGRSQASKAVWSAKKGLDNPAGSEIIINDKQFGKKIGKHAYDWGMDPANDKDREKLAGIIQTILNAPDEIRHGEWRMQSGVSDFYIKGDDVVVVNNGNFVSVLKGGINNARIKNARK